MKERNELQTQLIEKAMKDEAFREELLKNPKETIEREFEMKIPDFMNVSVLEEDAQTFYLVLPQKINAQSKDELTEAELMAVSGAGKYTCSTDVKSCQDYTLKMCY